MHFFLHVRIPCSAGRGSFLALSVAGQAGGPPVHQGASVVPDRAPWRALWAFKAARSGKSSWDRVPRRRTGPARGNPTFFCFVFFALSSQLQPSITPSHKLSSSLLCDSHGTSAVAHQALPVVTATDGASLSVRVCAMFPVALRIKNEDVISRAGQEIGHCEEGQDDVKPTLRDFKGTQSHGTRYNSIAALQALAFDMRTCKHYHISTYF